MSSAFATPYTIHFDDTMAYGSHHFLTGFKFQCRSRESLLYGDLIFDRPGVAAALQEVHLFTADGYNRNLHPAYLGDRLVIFLTLEEWGSVSARFCYRVINEHGQPIAAGYQSHVCADPQTGQPRPLPAALQDAFDSIRQISEEFAVPSFRDLVLAGGDKTRRLFGDNFLAAAQAFLSNRHPIAGLIELPGAPAGTRPDVGDQPLDSHGSSQTALSAEEPAPSLLSIDPGTRDASWAGDSSSILPLDHVDKAQETDEVWFFPGQGTFDPSLLSDLIAEHRRHGSDVDPLFASDLQQLAPFVAGDLTGFLSGDAERCAAAVAATPSLIQLGIFLQGVLTAQQRMRTRRPGVLVGHSLGEIAALTTAGSLDLVTAFKLVALRTQRLETWGPPNGGLLAVFGSRSFVREELDLVDTSEVVIAGRNHDGQTLLSGPRDSLADIRARLAGAGVRSVEISSPFAFHHPSLYAAADAWRGDLEKIEFRPPQVSVYSIIGRHPVEAGPHLATALSVQLIRPFDFQGAVEDLVLAGFRNFVDCGSTGILLRLLQAAAPDFVNCDLGYNRNGSTLARTINDSPLTIPSEVSPPREVSPGRVGWTRRPQVVITGQGCLLPGGAHSPAALGKLLDHQRSGIEDLCRFDPEWEADFYSATLEPDRATSSLAGRVWDGDLVPKPDWDPVWFESLSRAQQIFALAVDQCRPALERAEEVLCLIGATADGFEDQDRIAALRYAGLGPGNQELAEKLAEKAGAFQSPYEALNEVLQRLIPGSVKLRLLDAACASSLYAVAIGMSALENRQAQVVLVGGVYCPGPGNNCLFSQFKGLTDSACRPFDAQASGVVFAEGAAMLVMRRSEDLVPQDGPPLAVVRGAGLSSDGRSPSANVPKSAGQILALQRCYENYEIEPAGIAAIEGHGTATPTGDATEIRSLTEFFAPHAAAPIPLHSMKGLIGHTGWAAGSAAILTALHAIQRRRLPGQANFRAPSPALTAAAGILQVSAQETELPQRPLRIGVDGFGFGGANAHVVIEEWVDAESHPAGPLVASLSDEHQTRSDSASLDSDHELCVVADFELSQQDHDAGYVLPNGMVILPDLADDLDVTQRMAVLLAHGLLQQVSGYESIDRQETSIVLAIAGKSQRACEATLRILGPRLARQLPQEYRDAVLVKHAAAKPSGPYTLQGMMPNVAPGRAALMMNLNGPNFAIDAGSEAIEGIWEAAEALLHSGQKSGTQIVVAGYLPNQGSLPNSSREMESPQDAMPAAAMLVTTRRLANRKGWTILRTRPHKTPNGAEQLVRSLSVHGDANSGRTPQPPRPTVTAPSVREDSRLGTQDLERPPRNVATATPQPTEIHLATTRLDPQRDQDQRPNRHEFPVQLDYPEIVNYHLARNIPTLPGAWVIDQMIQSFLRLTERPGRQIEVTNVNFLKFAKVIPGSSANYRIVLEEQAGSYQAWLLGNVTTPRGDILKHDEVFATATLRSVASQCRMLEPHRRTETLRSARFLPDPYCNRHHSIRLSGPFECLPKIAIGDSGRIARFEPRLERLWYDTVPALAIDAAIRVAGMHVVDNGLHVPTSITRILLPLGVSSSALEDAHWEIFASPPQLDGPHIRCGHVDLVDSTGRVQATIDGAVVTQLN